VYNRAEREEIFNFLFSILKIRVGIAGQSNPFWIRDVMIEEGVAPPGP